jgi:hypothetical protein
VLLILGYGLRDASRLYRPRNASVATELMVLKCFARLVSVLEDVENSELDLREDLKNKI